MSGERKECQHPDLRTFDNVLCCLSCGETVHEDAASGAQTACYQYQRLGYGNGHQVRLITILPGKEEEPLNCDVIHADLDEEPVYEAISYTWATETGDAQRSQLVFCRGRSVHVTKNCESALRAVRQQYRRRTVWIDAICIDQSNVEERNHQVNLMSSIYQTASQVLAYLGPGTRETRPALYRVMSHLDTMSQTEHAEYPDPPYNMRNDVRAFLELPYFDRVWILQELALAKLVTLLAGNRKIAWTAVTVRHLSQLCSNLEIHIPSIQGWVPARKPQEGRLLEILQRSRNCSASDPRDKVFALLGLIEQDPKDTILVDYSLPPEQVFTMVATRLLSSQGHLDVLKYTSNQALNLATAPSWVPMWDLKDIYQPLPSQFTPLEMHALSSLWFSKDESGSSIRAATLATQAKETHICALEVCERVRTLKRQHGEAFERLPDTSSTPPVLRVRAHRLDVIAKVFVRFDQHVLGLDLGSHEGFSSVNFCSSCLNHKGTRCKPSHNIALEQSRSIEVAFDRVGQWKSTAWINELSDEQHFLRFKFENGSYSEPMDIMGTPFKTEHSIGLTRRGVRFKLMRAGATVWALAGVDVPFVLRKIEGHYELIGECYLHRATLNLPCACCGRDAKPWPIVTEVIDIW